MNEILFYGSSSAESSVIRAAHSLGEIGLVECVDGGGPGSEATFFLAESGFEYANNTGYPISSNGKTCDGISESQLAEKNDQ